MTQHALASPAFSGLPSDSAVADPLTMVCSVVQCFPEAAFISDPMHCIRCVNQPLCHLWNIQKEEFLGVCLFNVIHSYDCNSYRAILETIKNDPIHFSTRFLRPDHQPFIVNMQIMRLNGPAGNYHLHIVTGFEESQNTALAPPQDRTTPSPGKTYFARTDVNGMIVEASELFTRSAGFANRPILGLPIQNFLIAAHWPNCPGDPHLSGAPDAYFETIFQDSQHRTVNVIACAAHELWNNHPTVVYTLTKNSALTWMTVMNKFGLTQRESDVVLQLCKGQTSAALASRLNILPATVRTHLRNIFTKIGVNSRVELLSLIFNNMMNELST